MYGWRENRVREKAKGKADPRPPVSFNSILFSLFPSRTPGLETIGR